MSRSTSILLKCCSTIINPKRTRQSLSLLSSGPSAFEFAHKSINQQFVFVRFQHTATETVNGEVSLKEKKATQRVFEFDANGDFKESEITKTELASKYRLPGRDLRVVDPAFKFQSPVILPRNDLIVVFLEDLRAIISCDKVLLFDILSPKVVGFTGTLQSALRREDIGGGPGTSLPYEHRALEAILLSVCTRFSADFLMLREEIERTLSAVKKNLEANEIENLLNLRNSLDNMLNKVEEVGTAIKDVLASDQDMVEMYLTTKVATGHRRRIDQHEEVEMLLETYYKQVQEIQSECIQVRRLIENTQEALNIHLDNVRNEMMRKDLNLTLGTFAVACGSAVAGCLGMNVPNGMEANTSAFGAIVGGIGMSSAIFYGLMYKNFKKKRLL